jgi:hypothetical protein
MNSSEKESYLCCSSVVYFWVPACTVARKFKGNKIKVTFPITHPFWNVTNSELAKAWPDVDMVLHGLHSVVCHSLAWLVGVG